MSKQKQPKIVRTPEQVAADEAAVKQRLADLKAYDKKVEGMSHNQLRGELRRMTKEGPGLNAAEAIASLLVLENTKTRENPFAKLHAYPR